MNKWFSACYSTGYRTNSKLNIACSSGKVRLVHEDLHGATRQSILQQYCSESQSIESDMACSSSPIEDTELHCGNNDNVVDSCFTDSDFDGSAVESSDTENNDNYK